MRSSRPEVARMLAGALLLAVLAWGVAALFGSADASAIPPAPAPTAVSPRDLLDPLPGQPTPTPTYTVTPSPVATATDEPQATLTGPRPSPSATPTVQPTATPTPIHAPADTMPDRITIPVIGLDAAIVGVGIVEKQVNGEVISQWDVADYAAGFHQGMALPGHAGNTVISGHNNIRGEVFRDLHKLERGDDIYLWVGYGAYRYKVDVVYRVPITGAPERVVQQNTRWILPTDDQRLTLVTCWPYWSNTHRTIVIAYPAPWDDSAQPELN